GRRAVRLPVQRDHAGTMPCRRDGSGYALFRPPPPDSLRRHDGLRQPSLPDELPVPVRRPGPPHPHRTPLPNPWTARLSTPPARPTVRLHCQLLEDRTNPYFLLGGRWDATATDGPGLNQGDATTLTWGLVADGTSVGFLGPSGLIARLDAHYGAGPGGPDLT